MKLALQIAVVSLVLGIAFLIAGYVLDQKIGSVDQYGGPVACFILGAILIVIALAIFAGVGIAALCGSIF